ncbi:hypothetical protein ACLB2K_073405 [Fragaria x ananassa]
MRGRQTQTDTSAALVLQAQEPSPLNTIAPIVSSYNDKTRPLLDAIDKLRDLKVTEEGIQLPTIVVVGDNHPASPASLNPWPVSACPVDKVSAPGLEDTDEVNISEDIINATNFIAGGGKEVSNAPLTLLVKKNGVPDLTMVDLPGISRVPAPGQPDNIYDQIKDIIMEMSHSVDKHGERTLAVVTKADVLPEGLLEKVTSDDVNIGLGCVCVRNRIGDETNEEARAISDKLFQTHPLLSKIDKAIVGISVLAQKLVQIQATSIARNLQEIVKKINDKLNACLSELNNMPKSLSTVAEAMTSFMQIIGVSKESLKKILVRGEFEEYKDQKRMHCTARLGKVNEIKDLPIEFVERESWP